MSFDWCLSRFGFPSFTTYLIIWPNFYRISQFCPILLFPLSPSTPVFNFPLSYVGHTQYSQVPHLLSIGWCRQASSDAFNKLRNLSLSHRKIHRRVSQYSILNTNHHHHDLLAIFNNGWHLSPPSSSPPSSSSVTTSPFLTMPIIRLKDGDSGVAISRGLSPTLFTQAQTEYFSFISYHHSRQTK